MFPFLVCKFAKGTLSNSVKECFGDSFPDVMAKEQIKYLYNYLDDLKAQSIIIEADYVDRDYLEDYSNYYVKCFNRYGERCARLHFFDNTVEHGSFETIFASDDAESEMKFLQSSYLGFIVIKPIPKTFIGRTCLKKYSTLPESYEKTTIGREYSVNLFGITLKIESIAFQEQDKVLSACATTAIWSTLHAIKTFDIKTIPSSSEITLSAINYISNSSNSFPNDGLSNKQIMRAIDVVGLRYHFIKLSKDKHVLFSIQRAFDKLVKPCLDSGIPLIMGAAVYDISKQNHSDIDSLDSLLVDGHAISIVGYSETTEPYALYVHDDRFGPYARALITPIKDICPKISDERWCLTITMRDENGQWETPREILVPDCFIIPVDKKVRIPASFIHETCERYLIAFNAYMKQVKKKANSIASSLEGGLTFKIKLESLSELKTRVIKDTRIFNRKKILLSPMSRFVWVAEFSLQESLVCEFLFDSTDIPQGKAVLGVIKYNEKLYEVIKKPILVANEHVLLSKDNKSFIGAIANFFGEKEVEYFEYLSQMYGELRAPIRLKDEELLHDKVSKNDDLKKFYGRTDMSFDLMFDYLKADDANSFAIWAISKDGALLIGKEIDGKGHPTLTGFQSARIAGEVRRNAGGWFINSKSGRYSGDYENPNELLKNARKRFVEIFSEPNSGELTIEEHYS